MFLYRAKVNWSQRRRMERRLNYLPRAIIKWHCTGLGYSKRKKSRLDATHFWDVV